MDKTLVDYLYEPHGPTPFKCGYCKSPDTSKIQGVLAHRMTCRDFQELVDRGFQRSGKFVYRPFMRETCCPQYVFRTDVTKFRLSKQQRATIRKMNRYLTQGETSGTRVEAEEADPDNPATNEAKMAEDVSENCSEEASRTKRPVRPGAGPDPSKPPCKKAKLLRRERRAKKATEKGQKIVAIEEHPMDLTNTTTEQPSGSSTTTSSSHPTVAEWVEEQLTLPHEPSHPHRLTTRLVLCSRRDPQFNETYKESYQVFRKFQLEVHRDNEEDCQESHFNEFLVETPLIGEKAHEGSPCDFGSYHLQYLIDGKIFAVGVLDIIPKGVLCEYLFYDPAYRFVAPGVYSALNEIALSQRFLKLNPEMQYYYMGFYVQSCPKMNYKRRYASSELLCPQTHNYVPLPQCIPRLKVTEYCRLDDNAPLVNERDEVTEEVIGGLKILHRMEVMLYREYLAKYGEGRRAMVESYVELVGQKVAGNATLHIPSSDML